MELKKMKNRKATCLVQRKASEWGSVPLFQFPEGSTRSLLSWDCVTVTVPEQGCRPQVLPLDEVLWAVVTGLTSVCVGVPRTPSFRKATPPVRTPSTPPSTWDLGELAKDDGACPDSLCLSILSDSGNT